MFLKTKSEFEAVRNTTQEGTRENPKVELIPWMHNVARFLGYQPKWDHEVIYDRYYDRDKQEMIYTTKSTLKPVFKKSRDTFNFGYGCFDWYFLMEVLLPEMREANIITKDIQTALISLDKEKIVKLAINAIENYMVKNYPPVENPFDSIPNIVEPKQELKKYLIF